MKKALTPILAVVAVIAIIFCFVVNGQKGDAQNKLNDANAQLETLKSEGEAKLAEATAAKDEIQAKLDEATAAKDEIQAKLDEATAQIDTLKADAEAAAAQKTELEEKVNALTKQIEDAAAAAKEGAAAVVENATEAVTDAVEGAKDAAAEAVETATEAVTEAVEGAKDAATEAVAGEAAPMTHAEYIAAENDSEVVIESYVQDHQSWWDNKVTVYLQSEDGAYFAYEMACSEEDAAKLVPGTKIRVKGYKGEWAGEVEIMDGTFEFIEADPWIAEAADVTALLASEDLANHMNEFVAVKGATVVAQDNGEAFTYKNPEEKSDDLYFAVEVDGAKYNFCVEYYLCGKDTDVYKAVEGLKVGDVVDIEGFLYWYNGANLQATSLIVK